jgi:diamine N-acetyltransferase
MYEFDNLTMRAIEERDLETLRVMHNDPSTLYNLTDVTFVTPTMQRKWFESLDRPSSKRYVVEDENDLVAFVRIDDINFINRNACIGLDVMKEKRGKGFGKRCYKLIFSYLFQQLNMNMLWLYTADFNKAGVNLYEKVGMKKCGTLPQMLYRDGKYCDCITMYITKDMWSSL